VQREENGKAILQTILRKKKGKLPTTGRKKRRDPGRGITFLSGEKGPPFLRKTPCNPGDHRTEYQPPTRTLDRTGKRNQRKIQDSTRKKRGDSPFTERNFT